MFILDEINSNQEIFDEKTYRRLQVVKKTKPPFINSILDYLQTLPICNFVNHIYSSKSIESPPMKDLNDSKFSNFDSIYNAVLSLKTKYTILSDKHNIIIYGNNISQLYINHVGNMINWWYQIKPQKYTVILYLIDINKQLPSINTKPILTEEHINSGFTFTKSHAIHIFRKEELKVLIHELIHASNFDLNNNKLINIPLSLNDDNISNEGVTEYLAIIFYYWYIAQFKFNNTTASMNEKLNYFTELLSNDIGWQKYQQNKILRYFNLSPADLLHSNNFRQKTSVLSYFFLKHYFFNQDSLPIILSRDYNKINKLISGMDTFIRNYITDEIPHHSRTLRMSLYELKT